MVMEQSELVEMAMGSWKAVIDRNQHLLKASFHCVFGMINRLLVTIYRYSHRADGRLVTVVCSA
jgi:hypothetical protein